MNLYTIASNHNQALLAMADMDDLPEEVINDTMEAMEGDFNAKAISVAGFFLNIDADILAMKEAEKNMATRRKAKENQVSWMKNYLLENMLRTGITKIECPAFKISLRNNPEAVFIISEALIPAEFMRTKTIIEPDKTAIKNAGGCPGVELRRSHSVQIK
jgi:hypothetical protein